MTEILANLIPAFLMSLGVAAAIVIVWRLVDDEQTHDDEDGGAAIRRAEDPPFGPSWPAVFARRRAGPSDLAGSA